MARRITNVSADGTDLWVNSNGILGPIADNVLCSRLASAAHAAMNASAGDSIDRGLALLAELKKQGFGVIYLGEPARNAGVSVPDNKTFAASPADAPQPAKAAEPLIWQFSLDGKAWCECPEEHAANSVKHGFHARALRVVSASPATQPLDDFGVPIVYDTNDVDEVTHALTGDEGEEDSLTVLRRFAAYVENVWPGRTALEVLIELEERGAADSGEEKNHG